MALRRRRRFADAPAGPQQRGGRRRSGFLVSRGMTPRASGEESRFPAVASQAIEAEPAFGQMKPGERPLWLCRSGQRSGRRVWRIRKTKAGGERKTISALHVNRRIAYALNSPEGAPAQCGAACSFGGRSQLAALNEGSRTAQLRNRALANASARSTSGGDSWGGWAHGGMTGAACVDRLRPLKNRASWRRAPVSFRRKSERSLASGPGFKNTATPAANDVISIEKISAFKMGFLTICYG